MGVTGQAHAGESIVYPGAASQSDPLRPGYQALFPPSSAGNSLQINGIFSGRVYGGLAQGNGDASANSVDINADVTGNVHGGYVRGNGNAFGNNVRVAPGVTVNTLTEDAEFQGLTGGHTFGNFQAYGNTVDIYGTVSTGATGVVAGGYSRGNSNVFDNTLILRPGSSVQGTLYGGYNLSDSLSPSGVVSGNSVIVYGGTITGDIYGGYSDASGPGVSSEADNNRVFIYGGTITGDIYGGHSDNSSSDDNEVYLSGAAINGQVIGGHIDSGGGTARNNKITIAGGTGLNLDNAFLYGNTPGPANVTWQSDGNTLVIDRFKQSVDGNVYDVANFQNYRFIMHESMMNGDTFLNITNSGPLTDISASSIDVHVLSGSQIIAPGDNVYLFKANGNGLLSGTPASVSVHQGVSLEADLVVEQTADYLRLTIAGVHIDPDTEDESSGHVTGELFVNQAISLAAARGMRSAWEAACDSPGWTPFAAMSGGSVRQQSSGSPHADLDSFSLVTGLARRTRVSGASLLLGGFFEAGWGSYDTSAKGNGSLDYQGGGILSRFSMANGLYADASGHAGRLNSDYRNTGGKLVDGYGNHARFDSASGYIGAHAGLGYMKGLSKTVSMDVSTQYLWSRLDGDSVSVLGDPVRFKPIDSQRWQSGARFNYSLTEQLAPYIGAAYEYEFDGKSRATAYGYAMPSSTLKGGSGIGELGVAYKPEKYCGFSADLGVQGYTGAREGVTGSMQLKYEF